MFNFPMTENTKKIVDEAVAFSKRYGYSCVGTEALLYGICSRSASVAGELLASYNITRETVLNALARIKINHPKTNRFDFSDNAVYAIKCAVELANDYSGAVTSEQLLYGLLKNPRSASYTVIVGVLKVPAEYLIQDISRLMGGSAPKMKSYPSTNNIASQFAQTLENLFSGYTNVKDMGNTKTYYSDESNPKAKGKENNKEQTYNSKLPKDLLDMGIDMTAKVKGGKCDPIIGRDTETERVIEILCRKTKNNPVLIGEAGVGKSAVVEGLAQRIVKGNVPEEMKGKTIYSLDIGGLMAGTKYRGSMEEKLKNLIDYIASNKDIIVFIDEIHMLAQAGSKDGEIGPADMLKPYLARGEFQTIGATTNDEYRKFIEKDKALERRFQPVSVLEPSEEDCIKILKGIRPSFEKFHGVKISDKAIECAVTLSVRYIMDRFLPDKAIDLIDEAASKLKVKNSFTSPEIEKLEAQLAEVLDMKKRASDNDDFLKADEYKNQAEDIKAEIKALEIEAGENQVKSGKQAVVGEEDIAGIVSKWTKIPVSKLTESEREKLMKLEDILHKRVIGQDEAVVAVSKAIRRARAGLKDPMRPIGSFIFLGPTGVGKTELTKALAEALFDDENTVIRLDMSEYMESHSVAKLIGAPPGYVGHDDGGQLTEQVRRKPYSVVLFDEIEKAHPDVFNILLQMLDDGRLTDSLGKTVSFKNTVIILTSNVGVSSLPKKAQTLGFGEAKEENIDVKEHLTKALKEKFKPELLNRIDQTIIFDRLSKDDITKIANILINKLNSKLKSKNITLKFTKGAMQAIFDNGYDPEYGARPLKRYIEQNIEDGLAEEILMGNIEDNTSVVVLFKNGKFVFKKEFQE